MFYFELTALMLTAQITVFYYIVSLLCSLFISVVPSSIWHLFKTFTCALLLFLRDFVASFVLYTEHCLTFTHYKVWIAYAISQWHQIPFVHLICYTAAKMACVLNHQLWPPVKDCLQICSSKHKASLMWQLNF